MKATVHMSFPCLATTNIRDMITCNSYSQFKQKKNEMMQVVHEGFCSSTVDGTSASGRQSSGLQ
jgi:hypothetical protein